ncbi:MAG: hypothetical protein A2Y40_08570 [Candidatus Margulisbacteria bacterium GWF2_35_9]|nr:MAG: hypothetical protein A2Y40_08570 [Candidatus Margulisbacteria bacterium GWF2_35_9]
MAEINKYLIAKIRNESFGININSVQEIIRDVEVSKVPGKIEYLEGVISVRNSVIPLINLKLKLFGDTRKNDELIVVIAHDKEGENHIGFTVDEVVEVISIPDNMIDNPLFFSNKYGDNVVSGIGKLDSGLVVILNIDKLMTPEDMTDIESALKRKRKTSK